MPRRRLQDMSSRRLQDMSWTRLQRDNFSSCERSSRRPQDVLWGYLQDVLEDVKLLRWRRVEDVFKTSWRPNVYWANPRTSTKREAYCIHTLKTKASIGPNVEGGYWALISYSFSGTVSFPGFGRLVLGLLSDYSDYRCICLTYSLVTALVLFWFLRWCFLQQW